MYYYSLNGSPINFQNVNAILDVKYQAHKLSWHSLKNQTKPTACLDNLNGDKIHPKEQGGIKQRMLQVKLTS